MEIKVYSNGGILKLVAEVSDNSQAEIGIGVQSSLTLDFTTYEFVKLDANDYVNFKGYRFWLKNGYLPIQKSTIEYQYNLTFYGIEEYARKAILRDSDGDPIDSLDDSPYNHVKVIVDNINRIIGSQLFSVGDVLIAENQNIEYGSTDCLDALSKLAEAYETEYWFKGFSLNLGKAEFGNSIELGRQNGLVDLSREDNESVDFYTRLIPLGSTKNIDPDKYGHDRLQLPGGIKEIDYNTDKYGIIEHVEETAFEKIYPRYTGIIMSVRTENVTIDDEARVIYYFKDENLPFNPNDYQISGLKYKVTFQSGELNLRDFEINWHSDTEEFEIVNQFPYDNMNIQLPGDPLIPKVGDSYIPWNMRMPDEYYPLAEQEFQEEAEQLLQDNSKDTSVYSGNTDYVDVDKRALDLQPGQRIRLFSDKYFADGYIDTRIISMTIKLNNPSSILLKFSNYISQSKWSSLQSTVNSLVGVLENENITSEQIQSMIRNYGTGLFLSKLADDIAYGKITFKEGLKSLSDLIIGQYVGGLTGSGAKISKEGYAEMRGLTLWEWLEVPELRYNKVTINVGFNFLSNGAGIIESVTKTDDQNGVITLKLEDGEIGSLQVGDLCLGIWNQTDKSLNSTDTYDDGKGNYRIAGFGTSYFRIISVSGDKNETLSYAMRPISDGYPVQIHPSSGMHFAQYSNPGDTSRQRCYYSTTSYRRQLINMTTWEISAANIGMQAGDLSNLSVFGIDMSDRSMYLNNIYMSGHIDQSAELPNRLEFSWSNGNTLYEGKTTTVTGTALNGFYDVSDAYDTYIWTRDSGSAADDAVWNNNHTASSRSLTLLFSDLRGRECMFTLTATKTGVEPLVRSFNI